MGVYIKGIKMPKSCSDCFAERCIGSDFGCDILGFDDANTTCFTRERRKDCPLIHVQPHGRLIDADAILGKINAIISAHPDEADLYEQDAVIVRDWLRSEPTVIEREKT